MGISLKAMRYYCAAIDHGSIAKAAAVSNVAASAVAAAIDQIEAHFQLTLTIRQRARGIEATADGKLMAQRFRALLDEYESVLKDGADRRQSLSGELRIGYYAPVAPAFLPRILSTLMAPNPDLTLFLEACDNATAQESLRRGDYDAILFVSDGAPQWIEIQPLVEAPPYCLLAADHPLAAQESVSLRDLAGEALVSLDRPGVADYYRALFDRAGPLPEPIARCNSTEMVRSLVGASQACAILNMVPLAETSYAGDRLVARPIRDALPSLTLSVGYRPGPQRRALTAFIDRCVAYFTDPGPILCPPPMT